MNNVVLKSQEFAGLATFAINSVRFCTVRNVSANPRLRSFFSDISLYSFKQQKLKSSIPFPKRCKIQLRFSQSMHIYALVYVLDVFETLASKNYMIITQVSSNLMDS